MRRLLLSLLLIVLASPLFGAGWKKPYFAATPPGSWARYSDTAPDSKMTTTIRRLADQDGIARVELLVEFAGNQYPPVQNQYTLKPGFALDRQLIDYMSEISAGTLVSDGATTTLDDATVALIASSLPKYGPSVTFKGTETVGGHAADRYSYTLAHPGTPPTTESGDLWVSASVPFGVVKQSSVTKDAKGNVTTSYERLLVASGVDASMPSAASASKVAKADPKKTSRTLKDAYDAGLVSVNVTVDAAGHDGERAHLVIEKKDDEPMTLVIPKGKTSLHVDIPLDDFVFEVAGEKSFPIGEGRTAELDVKQLGEKRALEGKFTISTYEGTPLYSGSATVGWVKKK